MRAILVATALSLGCAATLDGSRSDGGASDSGPGAARCERSGWLAMPAVVVSPTSDPTHRLVDAVATADGAWVAYRSYRAGTSPDELFVTRVDEDGRTHPAAPSEPRRRVMNVPELVVASASMIAEGDAVEVLVNTGTDQGDCAWTRLTPGASWNVRTLDLWRLPNSPPLGGCRSLLRTAEGSTFAGEQLRATWGTSVVSLDRSGNIARHDEIAMTVGPTQNGIARIALENGDFLATWVESGFGSPPRAQSVRARRFGQRGETRGETHTLGQSSLPLKDAVLTRTPTGAFTLWEGPADSFPPSDALYARALEGSGAPRGELATLTSLGFVLGGISITTRGEEVLATAITARDGIRLQFLSLRADASLRAQVDTGLSTVDGPSRVARVVATPRGALVFTTIDQSERGGRVVAVPMRCP